jgi:hypothetical protein
MHGWVLSWVQAMDVMLKFESLCATGFRGKNSISINSWNSFNLPNTLISPYTWNSLCMCVSLSKLWVWRRLEGMGSMEKWEIDPEIAEIRFSSVTTRSGVWNSPWRAWQQNLRCPARTCGALRELAESCWCLLPASSRMLPAHSKVLPVCSKVLPLLVKSTSIHGKHFPSFSDYHNSFCYMTLGIS